MLNLNETVDLSKFIALLSYTFINSHSQVSDPGPKDPLVLNSKKEIYFCFSVCASVQSIRTNIL